MAKKQRVAKKSASGQRLAPSRHNIAKQSAAVLALGLGLAAVGPADATVVYVPGSWTLDTPGTSKDFFNVFGGNQFTAYLGLGPNAANVYTT